MGWLLDMAQLSDFGSLVKQLCACSWDFCPVSVWLCINSLNRNVVLRWLLLSSFV